MSGRTCLHRPRPKERLRRLLLRAAESKDNKVLHIEVSRAHFYAKAVRPTYNKLLAEDPRSAEDRLVGLGAPFTGGGEGAKHSTWGLCVCT